MNREGKAAVVDQVAAEIGASDAVIALDYRGITVEQISALRIKLRGADAKLQVTKNTLAERAADKAGAESLKPLLTGPTALALIKGDAAAAAKILSDTARDLKGPLEFKGGFIDGQAMGPAELNAIAKLPSKEVLYGQLVGVIAAPLNGLARTLNALPGGLAIQLGQIVEQGLVGTAGGTDAAPAAEAPAAEAESDASDDANTTDA